MHDDSGHQQQGCRQNHGDPRAGDITCRQALAGACDGQLPGRNNQADEEGKQDQPQAAVDGLASRLGEQPHQRGHARMLGMPQRGDAADAHQPGQQQARDLFGPGNRPVQDVAAHDLEAHDRGLRDDEDREGPLKREIDAGGAGGGVCWRAHPRIASSHDVVPCARASVSQSRSAAGSSAR